MMFADQQPKQPNPGDTRVRAHVVVTPDANVPPCDCGNPAHNEQLHVDQQVHAYLLATAFKDPDGKVLLQMQADAWPDNERDLARMGGMVLEFLHVYGLLEEAMKYADHALAERRRQADQAVDQVMRALGFTPPPRPPKGN